MCKQNKPTNNYLNPDGSKMYAHNKFEQFLLCIIPTLEKKSEKNLEQSSIKGPKIRVILQSEVRSPWRLCPIKGSLTRDSRLQVFFINQCPPGPWVSQ